MFFKAHLFLIISLTERETMGLKCDKCGGTEYYRSRTNSVKGIGWGLRGSDETTFNCSKCDTRMIFESKPDRFSQNTKALFLGGILLVIFLSGFILQFIYE